MSQPSVRIKGIRESDTILHVATIRVIFRGAEEPIRDHVAGNQPATIEAHARVVLTECLRRSQREVPRQLALDLPAVAPS